jgi:hypothetical protein
VTIKPLAIKVSGNVLVVGRTTKPTSARSSRQAPLQSLRVTNVRRTAGYRLALGGKREKMQVMVVQPRDQGRSMRLDHALARMRFQRPQGGDAPCPDPHVARLPLAFMRAQLGAADQHATSASIGQAL